MKTIWTKYATETGLDCGYSLDEATNEYRVKVFTGVPKMHLASARNEAGLFFEKNIEPKLKVNETSAISDIISHDKDGCPVYVNARNLVKKQKHELRK